MIFYGQYPPESALLIGIVAVLRGIHILLFGKRKLEREGRKGKIYSDSDVRRTRTAACFFIVMGLLIIGLCVLFWDTLKK